MWRSSARLAWRDLIGSRTRAAVLVIAMAVSIASASAVYEGAAVARQWLGSDSRAWLAGDVAVDTDEPISDAQISSLNAMRGAGIDWTMITWTMTMAASDEAPDPIFIGVKAVDPAKYPFYGVVSLSPASDLPAALRADGAVVSDRVLDQLHLKVGDPIRIGATPFVVTGKIAAEPERRNGIFGWGPRCILSRSGFARIAAAASGNSLNHRIVLRLPPGSDVKHVAQQLQALVPEGQVSGYRDAAAPEVSRVELPISFLSIAAFLALVLGAIGVGATVRLNLEQRMETLAILRINGARTAQMASTFLFETAVILAGGLVLGLPLGWAMEASLLSLASRYLILPHSALSGGIAILPSLAAALAILGPALAAPAEALRRLRPMIVMRRDLGESRPEQRGETLGRGAVVGVAALIAVAAAGGIAYRMIEDWKPALLLACAVALSTGVAFAIGAGALQIGKRWIPFVRRAPVFKLAMIGMCRTKSRAMIPIVCIALGVMTIVTTFEASGAAIDAVSAALPYGGANLVIANFEDSHRDAVRAFLDRQPGVETVELLTQTWLRVARVNGVPVEGSRYLVQCSGLPKEGAVVADDLASRIGARVGSRVEFETREGALEARVSSIYHPRPDERFWFTFRIACRGLPSSSLIQAAAVRVRPDRIEGVREAVNKQFPTLAAITSAEITSTIRGVTDDAMSLLRIVTWTAALGGLLVLMTVVAASRGARSREIAILATLGAPRRTILKIYSLEFATLGVFAGLIGNILAIGLNAVILSVLFHRPEAMISGATVAAAMLLTPLLTLAAGWVPSYRLLQSKPQVILRHE
jgi:putative ABC transport system permease protein